MATLAYSHYIAVFLKKLWTRMHHVAGEAIYHPWYRRDLVQRGPRDFGKGPCICAQQYGATSSGALNEYEAETCDIETEHRFRMCCRVYDQDSFGFWRW